MEECWEPTDRSWMKEDDFFYDNKCTVRSPRCDVEWERANKKTTDIAREVKGIGFLIALMWSDATANVLIQLVFSSSLTVVCSNAAIILAQRRVKKSIFTQKWNDFSYVPIYTKQINV